MRLTSEGRKYIKNEARREKRNARKRVVAKATAKAAPLGGDSLTLLLQALPELYPTDPSRPGVVLAYLGPGRYYASIARYEQDHGHGKKVIHQATGATVEEAVQTLAGKLIAQTSSVQKLAVRVRRSTKL